MLVKRNTQALDQIKQTSKKKPICRNIAVNHLINQAVHLSVRQGASQSVSQVVGRSVGRWVGQSLNCLTLPLPHPGAYFMNTRVAFLWHILLSSKEMPRMNCNKAASYFL